MVDGEDPGAVGAHRRQVLASGDVVHARLVSLDDEAREICYEMLDGPYRVRSYFSTIRVARRSRRPARPSSSGGAATTQTSRRGELQLAFGRDVYEAGVRALQGHFAGKRGRRH